MDPTSNLEEQLRIAKRILGDRYTINRDPERLAELVIALDEWIRKGGFLPDAWRAAQERAKVQSSGGYRCFACGADTTP